jgi:hypothetical protein
MLALVKTAPGPGHVELIDVPEPEPAAHQVKLEVAACGICGTDVHVRNDTFRNFPPVILGHEFVGRVVAEGAAVRGQTDPAARYAVLGATAVVDPVCPFVRSGDFILSPSRRGMGHGVHGAFARFAVARPDQLFRLDEALPAEEGALVEPLAAAVHAVAERSAVRAGDVALVSGPAPSACSACSCFLTSVFAPWSPAPPPIPSASPSPATSAPWPRSTPPAGTSPPSSAISPGPMASTSRSRSPAPRPPPPPASTPSGRTARMSRLAISDATSPCPSTASALRQLHVAGSVGYTEATWSRTMQPPRPGPASPPAS